ncbi:MAG: hypothetical protein JXA28_01700 [Bacteroidetes bacterium]|nr:hypothetical protein [Bacteroidota bacterium]
MTIDFQLYDVRLPKMVMNNVLFNRMNRRETRTTRTGCLESCFDTVIDNLFFGTPAEISREEVIDGMVAHAVRRPMGQHGRTAS